MLKYVFEDTKEMANMCWFVGWGGPGGYAGKCYTHKIEIETMILKN